MILCIILRCSKLLGSSCCFLGWNCRNMLHRCLGACKGGHRQSYCSSRARLVISFVCVGRLAGAMLNDLLSCSLAFRDVGAFVDFVCLQSAHAINSTCEDYGLHTYKVLLVHCVRCSWICLPWSSWGRNGQFLFWKVGSFWSWRHAAVASFGACGRFGDAVAPQELTCCVWCKVVCHKKWLHVSITG